MMDRTVGKPSAPGARAKAKKKGGGGSAIVNVVCVVISIGFLIGAVFMYTEWEKANTALEDAKNNLERANSQISEQTKRIDTLLNTYLGFPSEEAANPALATEGGQLKSARQQMEDRDSRIGELEHLLETTRSELEAAEQEKDTAIQQRQRNEEVRSQQVEELNDELAQVRDAMEKQRAELEQEIRSQAQQLAEAEMNLARAEEEWDEERKDLQLRIKILQAQLEEKTTKEEQRAGLPNIIGRVLRTNLVDGFVVIDIGREEGMEPDMRLEVYSQLNTEQKKALVVISDAGDKVSEARLLEYDMRRPIAVGDVVRGYITAKGKERFVVAGRFGEEMLHTKGELEMLIESRGGSIMEEVDLDTNYLILGDYTSDPSDPEVQEGQRQRELAIKLNVPIITYDRFLSIYKR
jgi:hypothetical protein